MWLRRNRGPCQPQEYTTFLLLLLGGEVEWITKAQQVFFPRHPSWKRQFKFCHTLSLPCQDNRALQSKADWSLLQHQPALPPPIQPISLQVVEILNFRGLSKIIARIANAVQVTL